MLNLKNENLTFLNGPQSAIDRMRKYGGATKGAFYLTDDTHRLYIGAAKATWSYRPITGEALTESEFTSIRNLGFQIFRALKGTEEYSLFTGNIPTDTSEYDYYYYAAEGNANLVYPLPVNAGIEQVDSLNDLPTKSTANDLDTGKATFYYIKDSNILCIYGRTGGTDAAPEYGWIQINTDTFIKSLQVASESTSAAYVTFQVNNTNEYTDANGTVHNGNIILNFVTDTASDVSYTPTNDEKGITINVKRAAIVAATDNTDNTKTNLGLVHYAKTGSETPIPAISNADSLVTFAPDDYIDSITADTTNGQTEIKIKGKSQEISAINISDGTPTDAAVLTITQKNGSNTFNKTCDLPSITYGQSANQTYHLGDSSGLKVYTIQETNSLISSVRNSSLVTANAMNYKGTIDASTKSNVINTISEVIYSEPYYSVGTTQPDSGTYYYKDNQGQFQVTTSPIAAANTDKNYYRKANIVIGDTWRISKTMTQDFTETEKDYFIDTQIFGAGQRFILHKGDLIIARGMVNDAPVWDIVPAGDEPSYKFEYGTDGANTAVLHLKDADNIYHDTNGFILKSDNYLPITYDENTAVGVFTLSHKTYTAQTFTENLDTTTKYTTSNIETSSPGTMYAAFDTVTGFTSDARGHITGITTKTIKQNYLKKIIAASDGLNKVNITYQDAIGNTTPLVFENTTAANSAVKISLAGINSPNTHTLQISAELKWGSFN